MFESVEAGDGDLYHTEVQWLIRDNVLKRIRHEIVTFINEKDLKNFHQFSCGSWLCQLAFLTDISLYLQWT